MANAKKKKMFTFFRVGSTGAFINIIKCRKKLYFID